jgi:hypothetical protein
MMRNHSLVRRNHFLATENHFLLTMNPFLATRNPFRVPSPGCNETFHRPVDLRRKSATSFFSFA